MRELAILLLLFGCGEGFGENNVAAPERGEPPTLETATPHPTDPGRPAEGFVDEEPEAASPDDNEETEEPEADPTPEEIAREVVRLESTVAAALAAAEEAETASTACEAAHDGLAAMIAEVVIQYPDRTRPVPPRRAFIRVCERLDHEVQQCLLPSYASVHTAECGVIAENIPAEDRARLDEVLRSE